MSSGERPTPFLADYERTVLATALEHSDTLDLVLAELREGDLYDSRHLALVALLREMTASGAPVDSVTVPEQIVRRGAAQAVGGVAYVIDLERWRAPSPLSIPHYLAELRQAGKLRAALTAADRIVELARSGASGDEAVDQAVGILVQAASTTKRADSAWSGDAVLEFRADRDRRRLEDASGRSSRCTTGYAGVDAIMPMLDGDVTVLAGRTGHGKSTTALNIVDHNALRGLPCAYFSLEMDRRQLAARHVSLRCGVPYMLALKGFAGDAGADEARWADGEDMLIDQRLPIRIYDDFGLTPDGIASRCWQYDRELRRLGFQQGLRLVVLDYLQKIEPNRKGGSREAEVSAISRAAKVLAGDLGAHVLALAQLKRAGDREDKRPQIYDLRESGSIEQDASNVLGCYWHYMEVHPTERPAWKHRYELNVLKVRAGELGRAELEFRPWCGRLLNPPPPKEEAPPSPPAAEPRRSRGADEAHRQTALLGGGS